MTRDDQPDHSEDPRGGRDTGAGYPEEQPGGAQPGEQRLDRKGADDAPGTSSDRESGPGTATGNPA